MPLLNAHDFKYRQYIVFCRERVSIKLLSNALDGIGNSRYSTDIILLAQCVQYREKVLADRRGFRSENLLGVLVDPLGEARDTPGGSLLLQGFEYHLQVALSFVFQL